MGFWQEKKKILLLVLIPLPLVFLAWLFFVRTDWLIWGIAGYYALLLLVWLIRKGLRKDDLQRGWEYACSWWYQHRKEDLSTLNATMKDNYFGKEKFAAYKVFRGGEMSATKSFLPLLLIVKVQPNLEMFAYTDTPTTEQLENPFLLISQIHVGSPSPTLTSELEPAFSWRKPEKKKKPREDDSFEEKEDVEED